MPPGRFSFTRMYAAREAGAYPTDYCTSKERKFLGLLHAMGCSHEKRLHPLHEEVETIGKIDPPHNADNGPRYPDRFHFH